VKTSKLYWQCRRGSLELDLLLKNYLKNNYPHATEHERQRFSELLKLEDNELLPELLSFLSEV
jgi:antitoxin CptB